MRNLKLAFLTLIMILQSGCLLVPVIDSVREMGVTPGSRKGLLPKQVKLFNEARFWGNSDGALQFVAPDSRDTVAQNVAGLGKDFRLVESKVERMEFDQEAESASVSVMTKFYKIPFYMVQEKTEQQKWQFSSVNGWQLASLSDLSSP